MKKLETRFPRYSRLLSLFPAPYRKQYGQQMLQTLADMLDDPEVKQSRVWLRTAVDLPLSLIYESITYSGGIMKNDMPAFVKRNALLSATLLLPFFASLLANGINKVIYHQNLYHSWLWSMPVLSVWVLWLPVTATLLALASLLVYLLQRECTQKVGWLKGLLEIRRDWPLLAAAIVGIGIVGMVFFHDSVHCVTGNPYREVTDWHHTWQCVQQKPGT